MCNQDTCVYFKWAALRRDREQVALNKDGPGQCSEHLQPVQPRTFGPWRVYVNIVLYFSSSNTVFWNAIPNGHMHSTDYCYSFRYE